MGKNMAIDSWHSVGASRASSDHEKHASNLYEQFLRLNLHYHRQTSPSKSRIQHHHLAHQNLEQHCT
ncbi:hypothetical protein HN51_017394, partial [Arachis hypogaea]